MSPVSYALALADQQDVPWIILTRESEIRLYAARADTGVGRKGRAETFVEVNLALLSPDRAGYLQLLFSAAALREHGTVEEILDNSARFAADLAVRLRGRVYFDVVPPLATAVASRLGSDPTEQDLTEAYEQVMVVLFRLLFVAYAEDKDLLPYRTNADYAEHSLSQTAQQILKTKQNNNSEDYRADRFGLWLGVVELWRAVYQGREAWGVPAYNGGLFSSDKAINAVGAQVGGLQLSDAEFGPVLAALLIDDGSDGEVGPVDFRSLSVREFGTIYEGLLESKLSVAQSDLSVDKQNNYEPATLGKSPVVYADGVYLHNRSGIRKDTGSYFTKPFAVEHLLEYALEPALQDHLKRLDTCRKEGDDAAVAEAFFDFRCADIAMGSGHFLVAAVDRIEARLSSWLALNSVATVTAELGRLRQAAYQALGDLGDGVEIETGSLLRRQVARHCVYGVDRNHIAVELARLSIWIHTFVPGLPLSFLDHNLVVGDSLAGVGTLDEVVKAFDPAADPATPSLFRTQIEGLLGASEEALSRLARTSDASKREIDDARAAHESAFHAVAPARAMFDVVAANRAEVTALPEALDQATFAKVAARPAVRALIHRVAPLHFPATFPEVFLRDRSGFDCILGNPPWEEVTVEEPAFWKLRIPKLRSMSKARQGKEIASLRQQRSDLVAEFDDEKAAAEQTRRFLHNGPYRGMGVGDPDLYKAFCWRFGDLTCNDGGAIGVVLPRTALAAQGSEVWRRTVLAGGAFADLTTGTNRGGWMFDDVGGGYSISLCALRKGTKHVGELRFRGPYSGLPDYQAGMLAGIAAPITVEEFLTWNASASLPLIPSPEALETFRRLREHPPLDSLDRPWRTRPISEFHATNDKGLFVLAGGSEPSEAWPVYTGASFNLWNPDTGVYYGTATPVKVQKVLFEKRKRSHKLTRSAFREFPQVWVDDKSTLPCLNPRIAFRDITNRNATRTVIAALIPGDAVATNKAPYLLWPIGTAADTAFVLGVLSTMVLDWFARRIIELNMNFYLVNNFPIPDVAPATNPRAARVAEIAGRLAAVDDRYAEWAAEVGVPVDSVTSDTEKDDLIAELDAQVAHLYGLKEHDLAVIYTTFHEKTDHSARHAAVLEHFRNHQ